MTPSQRTKLADWSSLAQWIGTEQGNRAIASIEKVWPGYRSTATGSILNAYYTEPTVVDTVWKWLKDNGVDHGHGWEPGCGRGTWISAAPAGCSFDGVDIDPISVKVTGLLTGQHTVVGQLEDWTLADTSRPDNGGYDFVAGNVPFSANKPGRNNANRDNLHNLAVMRAAEMLRPGGVAAVITSRYALDASTSQGWRERLHEHVDLVAAFRLPSGTHKSAGTSVVTDLLILRRPADGEQRPDADWLNTTSFEIDGETYGHNSHFEHHPERVLGTYEAGGAWSPTNFSVNTDRPTGALLAEQLATVGVDYSPHGRAPQSIVNRVATPAGRALPAGSIIADPTSATGFSRDGVAHKCPKTQGVQLAALCAMRNAALEYLDDPTEDGRLELAGMYQGWREHSGPLSDYQVTVKLNNKGEERSSRIYPQMGGFRRDPSWWNVAALESFDDDTHTAMPAPMLQRDTLTAATVDWPDHADTLTQAVANTMARHHHIDAGYVAGQLGVTLADAETQLATVAFDNPTSRRWEVTAQYLSGDVVTKLDEAVAAAEDNPARYGRNVVALTEALPTPLTPAEIHPELGVTWLSAEDMTQFLHDHVGSTHGRVLYHPPSGTWSCDGYGAGGPADFRTSRKSMLEQIVAGCNAKPTTVWSTIEQGGKEIKVVNGEATAQEQLCRDNINEALVTWCWSDPQRAERLGDHYNTLFNRHRSTDYDGSHLTLPGLATDFHPRPHQKDVVWRILTASDSGTLMAHGVGAGKTAAMVIAAQEARRSGRVPGTTMFAVPRNMVEQFSRDYLRLYPAARIITPQRSNSNQKVSEMVAEFAARVATGDFDAAICSHEAFVAIPLSPDDEKRSIENRIADYETVNLDETASRREQRKIENQLASFRNKLAALNEKAQDPNTTYFGSLPIGSTYVDEAHLAKNIALMTAREGLPMPDPSARAEGILARTELIRERHGDGAVVMATATPITNSPAEMWVFGRLVSPRALERAGIRHFDAFAANFLSPVETVEHKADLTLQIKTRLADYRNFPDLARMFRSFADVRKNDNLGFDLPTLAGGGATVHLAAPTDQQLVVTDWARERVAGKHLALADGQRDPIIAILHATRAASLHPATISAEIAQRWATTGHPNLAFDWDEPNNKLIDVADTVAAIHHRTAGHVYEGSERTGAAQAVFCDQGVPNAESDHSVYAVVTDLLVERGVPRNQIAWVHDWPQPDTRQPLWDQVRNGNIRVVIGSTMQMGVGVNIQTRLYAAHEITAPYRPDWLTQAEGRMIRQGNSHDVVELHRYVTEKTADAGMWQILERKARFIDTAMSHPDELTRDLRDESIQSTAEEYATISALATGDNRHIELASVTGTVDRLERAKRAHGASRDTQQRSISHGKNRIEKLTAEIGALRALTPIDASDAEDIGAKIIGLGRADRIVTLAGVTYDVRRDYEELRLEIPDTGVIKWIKRDRLNPADEGRGLAKTIFNEHDRIGSHITERTSQIDDTQRQIDAEIARPVPEVFARQGELDTARARKIELAEQLKPQQPRHVDDTGAAAVDPDIAAEHPTPRAPRTGDAVFGTETPSIALRLEWAGAFRSFDPMRAPNWGNRAKGRGPWLDAVNAFSLDVAKYGTKPEQIGQYNGVLLTATCDGTTIEIAPNRHHGRFNTLSAEPGKLTAKAVEDWLHSQHARSITERVSVQVEQRHPRPEQGPRRDTGHER